MLAYLLNIIFKLSMDQSDIEKQNWKGKQEKGETGLLMVILEKS